MSSLTKEQLEKIEANRKLAVQRRQERLKLQTQGSIVTPSKNINLFQCNSSASYQNICSTSSTPPYPKVSSEPFTIKKSGSNFYSNEKKKSQHPTSGQKWYSKTSDQNDSGNGHAFYSSNSQGYVRKVNKLQNQRNFGENLVTGNCRLLSRDRFVVVVPYHAQLIDIFKSVSSRAYDPNEKTWNFSLSDYPVLMKKIQDLNGAVSISGLPTYILQAFQLSSRAEDSFKDVDLSRIDRTLVDSLMPFQKDGIIFGISKNGRCLLADDMGLGKTIQALGISHYYKDDWPLLIVCPSSVRYLWMDAILTWLPSVSYHAVQVMTSGKDFINDAQILITSYDLMSRCEKKLKNMKFGAFIMDESHFLKSQKSARTKVAMALLKTAKRILMLSGTPALSRPIELYPQISALNPALFPSSFEFGIRYCSGVKNSFGWDFSGSSNMQELQLLLESKFMIRRLKPDVISQLPPKLRQMVILNPDLVHDKTTEMKKCALDLDQKHMTAMQRRGALLTYYCATGKAKLRAIQDYVADLLCSDKKFICFAHHVAVLDGICSTIIEKNREYIRIDGHTSSSNRKILCDKFQYEEKYSVAVLSITAANAGITLTAAHLVVFAELYWNPGILSQAEDRAHRIGQEDSVLVQYLVAKGTADDHLWPLIQKKLDVLNKAGLSKDNFMNTEDTLEQSSKTQPSILNYFSELSCMDDDLTSEMFSTEEYDDEIKEKRPKLSE